MTAPPTAADNACRWDGARRGHYEVWYLTCNHLASRTGYWIRYTLEAPLAGRGDPYAQLWFARFDKRDPSRTFAINRVVPIETFSAGDRPFCVRIGDAELRHDAMRGAIAGAGHDVSWDLRWRPAAHTHRHLPGLMYRRGGLGDTTVLSPNLDVPVRGTVRVDGRAVEFSGDPGGQTHLWGRKHAHAWAWGHCNAFDGHPGAAFEVLTVRLRRRGRVSPPLTLLSLYAGGAAYCMTGFADTLRARGTWTTGRYAFRAERGDVRIEGEFSCRPDDMVVARYADPDGEPAYCSNTEVGDLRVTLWRRAGRRGPWREQMRLVAPGTGHFETGGRTRDRAVVKDHVTV